MNIKTLFSAVLLIAISFGTNAIAQKDSTNHSNFKLCHTEYALCTFAKCGPATGPKGHQTTVCSCRVWKGYSVAAIQKVRGKKKGWYCDGPKRTPGGTTHILSRYYPVPGYGTCADNSQWAMCLDDTCKVDPNKPHKANCTCQVETRKAVEGIKPTEPILNPDPKYDYLAQYGDACGGGIISSATVLDLNKITTFIKTTREIPVQPFIVAKKQPKPKGK